MNLHHHLIERYLNTNRYSGVMVFDDVIIFPMWNLSGMMVGYQQYRPGADKTRKNDPRDGRYYTSVHGDKYSKPIAIWGLESFDYRGDILVITEGIFDASRFHNMGIPAVALLSSSYKHYRNWLTSTGRKVYKVEDDHGSSLGTYQNLLIPEGRNDVGECTDEEVVGVINQMRRGKK